MNEELYRELGLGKSASGADIKKAYRKLARQFHPDKNKDNPQAEERFKKVSAAYAVLSDKKKKSLYDKYGVDGLRDGFDENQWNQYGGMGGSPFGGGGMGGFSGFGGMESIFETLFSGAGGAGGRGRHSRAGGAPAWGASGGQKGADVKSSLDIDLMDAVLGKELELLVPVAGQQKKLKVKIPKGIETGKSIRLKNQGEQGMFGGGAGDLLLELKIREGGPYRRQGSDLVKEQDITVGQAYLGETLKVETPWGEGNLKVPAHTQGGTKMRIKGHGIRQGDSKGDLYVHLNIQIPTATDKKTEELIKKLEKKYESASPK